MPNIENFRAFVLAAELGSFSAAARQMGKAQSAVSTAIANLEIDADVQLFVPESDLARVDPHARRRDMDGQ